MELITNWSALPLGKTVSLTLSNISSLVPCGLSPIHFSTSIGVLVQLVLRQKDFIDVIRYYWEAKFHTKLSDPLN